MHKSGKNPSQIKLTNNQEIIDDITFGLAILLNNFIKDHKNSDKIMEAFFEIVSSDKKLANVGMTLNLRNMNHEQGIFPEQVNKELSRILLKNSQKGFLHNPSTLTKMLNGYERIDFLSSIKGKRNIKEKSPKSIPRKPKAGQARRVGYPRVRILTRRVDDYKQILSNPQAVDLINRKLIKYARLEKVYDLITKDAFYAFKKGDKKFYDFLQIFTELFPNMDTSVIPDSKLFQDRINSSRENLLEKLRKEFVNYLLENPASSVFFIFSLAKLADDNND